MQNKKKTTKKNAKKKRRASKAVLAKKSNPSAVLAIKKMEAKTVLLTKNFLKAAQKDMGGKGSKTSFKQFIYMTLSVLIGLLAGTMLRFLADIVYLKRSIARGIELEPSYFLGLESFIPASFWALLLFCGLAFGIFLGFWGWKAVYVEGRRFKL